MSYKYKVKYFCGGNVLRKPINQQIVYWINLFEHDFAVNSDICGQTGIKDLLLDFNAGLRLQVPKGNFHICIRDSDSGIVILEEDASETVYISMEKYCVHWAVEVQQDGEYVFAHEWNPAGQKVHFKFAKNVIGDVLSLLPYVEAFGETYACEMTCEVPEFLADIVRCYYPQLRIIQGIEDDTYACYYMYVFTEFYLGQAEDSRIWPFGRIGESILGVAVNRQRILPPQRPREIKEPYVCIAVQASSNDKAWLNVTGWDEVVAHLLENGYRVLCIDKDREKEGSGLVVRKPEGAEDFTGNIPLMERLEMLCHAEFFVGLPSGLSWLARLAGCPVVMVGGFTNPNYEFETPYRVYNKLVCHGCWHDLRLEFPSDPPCPLHAGTDRAFECSKLITGKLVIKAIERLRSDLRGVGR